MFGLIVFMFIFLDEFHDLNICNVYINIIPTHYDLGYKERLGGKMMRCAPSHAVHHPVHHPVDHAVYHSILQS